MRLEMVVRALLMKVRTEGTLHHEESCSRRLRSLMAILTEPVHTANLNRPVEIESSWRSLVCKRLCLIWRMMSKTCSSCSALSCLLHLHVRSHRAPGVRGRPASAPVM